MQEKDQCILTITRCISIIIQIRKQIDKPLSKVTKDDIKGIFQWMEEGGIKIGIATMIGFAIAFALGKL